MMRFIKNKNARVAAAAGMGAIAMIGAAYAAVPLYNLFCRVTGYGGTTQIAEAGAREVLDREVEVLFDANTDLSLPWTFEPAQRSMTVNVGQTAIAYYRATNHSDEPVTGVASFNVTPYKAGRYFSKIECFCFSEQTLQPGQSIDMPVLFFVDPEMDEQRDLDDVTVLTLSYTFYRTETEPEPETAGAAERRDAAP